MTVTPTSLGDLDRAYDIDQCEPFARNEDLTRRGPKGEWRRKPETENVLAYARLPELTIY